MKLLSIGIETIVNHSNCRSELVLKLNYVLRKKGTIRRLRHDLENLRNPIIANQYKELLDTYTSQINKD